MSKQTKITRSARGQECQIRVPGVCNGMPDTTVLAHLNGGGIAMKHNDIHGAYACSSCHSFVDGGYAQTEISRNLARLWHLDGIIRTQQLMINEGLINYE